MSFPLSSARGRTRVSAAVLDATTTIAAGDVQGVLSVESLTGGAMLGGALGGTLGLAQGGPLGAAVGASAGAAVGAAAGHALRDRAEVEAALLDVLGLRPGRVTVEVVDVVSPEAELAPHPSS